MKFYLCQTAEGPRYARTQVEAKALDPRFEIVNYDTDQAALVERFNELLAQPATVTVGDSHTIDALDTAVALEPEEARPARKVKDDSNAARNMTQVEMEEAIFAFPASEAYRLDALTRVIEARREELAA